MDQGLNVECWLPVLESQVVLQVVKLPRMRSLSQQLLLDILDALADEMNSVGFSSETASPSQRCS